VIKICGMREPQNIKDLSKLPIDLIGTIFYEKSHRYSANRDDTAESFANLPSSLKGVGVFVNSSLDYLEEMQEKFSLSYLQLHGSETPQFCRDASKIAPVIKAFGIKEGFDFSVLKKYEPFVELFVFDTSTKQHGGSGKKFDWSILQKYQLKTKFLLSGGIGYDDLESINEFKHKSFGGVDLNSGFEIKPALKNTDLISQFLEGYMG
jgi:phosphoribosylanthranilate isomerase